MRLPSNTDIYHQDRRPSVFTLLIEGSQGNQYVLLCIEFLHSGCWFPMLRGSKGRGGMGAANSPRLDLPQSVWESTEPPDPDPGVIAFFFCRF